MKYGLIFMATPLALFALNIDGSMICKYLVLSPFFIRYILSRGKIPLWCHLHARVSQFCSYWTFDVLLISCCEWNDGLCCFILTLMFSSYVSWQKQFEELRKKYVRGLLFPLHFVWLQMILIVPMLDPWSAYRLWLKTWF